MTAKDVQSTKGENGARDGLPFYVEVHISRAKRLSESMLMSYHTLSVCKATSMITRGVILSSPIMGGMA